MRDEWEEGTLVCCRNCGMELTGEEGLDKYIDGTLIGFCCRQCVGEYYQHREQPV